MKQQRQRAQVLGAGIFSLILTMGMARFAYTPLLPLMQRQAGLGVAEAGWLAAINYAGYLSGALLAALVKDLALKDRCYRLGLLLAVASTAMMAGDGFAVWALSRYLAGLSSAAGMLLGAGLVLHWLMRHDQRPELGIHYSGIGLGIVVCSLAAAWMAPQLDWRQQWLVLTGLAALLAVPALAWLPRPAPAGTATGASQLSNSPPDPSFLRVFMAAYFCAGVGYVVSATFIVAIVERLPGLAGRGQWAFLVMGLAAAPASVAWDFVARRIGHLNALITAAVLQIAGILLPVAVDGLAATLAGALLFGGTFIGIVSLVLTMAGRYYPGHPARMMGRMTLAYGAAQIAAPAVTGWLATRFGGYAAGLYLAAAAMALGTVLLLALKWLPQQRRAGAAPAST
ncbi:MAG: hypothetical protein RJA36_3348 [Pseudomonadota bacterium]|jgi:predicted MFS family arabinose efflux permease